MQRLSVVIITKNEAHRIAACLQSVAFADEIVVVDSGSTDDTVALARAAGARVEVTADWPGFGPQKNRALALASLDWVLALDADERVSPALAASIRAAVARGSACAYALDRRSSFLGRVIRWGDWRHDYVTRLFPRNAARYSNAAVHERLITTLPVERLAGALWHDTYPTEADVAAKTEHYSTLGAQQLAARGKRATMFDAVLHGVWAAFRCYLMRLGFLDGLAGLKLAQMQGRVAYLKYKKLRTITRRS